MKKITAIIITALIALSTVAQQTAQQPLTRQDYFRKSRVNALAGTLCLAGGLVMTTVGAVGGVRDAAAETNNIFDRVWDPDLPQHKSKRKGYGILFVTGSIAVISSIPLFIGAGSNSRKAKALSLNLRSQEVMQIESGGMAYHVIPAMSLKLSL